ncbi:MAG: S-layer homology domain-containing protein [Bacillota bacterium]
MENDVTGELEYNSNNPNVTVKENNGTITISAASGSGGQTAEITAYYENKDADWVYKGIVNISTPSTGGPGAGPTPTVITLPTDPEKANQEVQKNLSDLVQQAASDPAKAAEQVASLVQAIVQAKVELAAGTKEQFVNTVTTVLQATGQLPEKAVQETGKGNYAVNEQAALAQVEQLVKVAQNLQQAVENLNKATGAGIQAPPPPVLTVRAKELGAEGKAQVTIPAAATAKLAEAIPEAAVRVSTPAGALVLPAAETTKATGGKGTLGVGFKETAVSGVSLPGGRLVSKVVDVTVTASSDAVTRTIASFTRPIQLFVPYNKGQVLNPDALGVYKLLEGGRVKFVGGKVLPDGTVGAQLKSLSAYTVLEYSKTFADLAGHWAKKDVEIMASRHVARGISETQFAPDADVTRAQFAALLIRTLGIDEAAPTGTVFSDVPKGAWYAGAVETAYAHQLVSGMGGGLFAPDEKITREQMAVMITRALKAAGKPATLTQAQITEVLKAYADRAEVSPWATQAMAEAVSTGIVKGRTATTLVPQGTATRAEAVVMLKRLIDAAGIY